jgi:hypothetical protein
MFKFSTRAEVTRKYYERRIRHFFDLIGFDLESKLISKNGVITSHIKEEVRSNGPQNR